MRISNHDDASAGGLLTLVAVFIAAGLFFVINGYGIDKLTAMVQAAYISMPVTQFRYDIVNYEIMVFRIEPIILLFGIGINHIVVSMREYSGIVSMGDIIWGAAQMITGTLFIIAITLYCGAGLDTLMYTVTGMNFNGSVPVGDLYGAVQYVGPVIYGFLLIICMGLVINFLVLCVQVVDYSTSKIYSYS